MDEEVDAFPTIYGRLELLKCQPFLPKHHILKPGQCKIGKGVHADFQLQNSQMNLIQCMIDVNVKGWATVCASSSFSVTKLNNERVLKKPHVLKNKDVIDVGDIKIVYINDVLTPQDIEEARQTLVLEKKIFPELPQRRASNPHARPSKSAKKLVRSARLQTPKRRSSVAYKTSTPSRNSWRVALIEDQQVIPSSSIKDIVEERAQQFDCDDNPTTSREVVKYRSATPAHSPSSRVNVFNANLQKLSATDSKIARGDLIWTKSRCELKKSKSLPNLNCCNINFQIENETAFLGNPCFPDEDIGEVVHDSTGFLGCRKSSGNSNVTKRVNRRPIENFMAGGDDSDVVEGTSVNMQAAGGFARNSLEVQSSFAESTDTSSIIFSSLPRRPSMNESSRSGLLYVEDSDSDFDGVTSPQCTKSCFEVSGVSELATTVQAAEQEPSSPGSEMEMLTLSTNTSTRCLMTDTVSDTGLDASIVYDENDEPTIATPTRKSTRKRTTSKLILSPYDDSGLKQLMKSPRVQKQPCNDLTNLGSVKALQRTPKAQRDPKNDLSDLRGVKKLMATPKAQKSPYNDLSNPLGVKRIMKTPTIAKSPKNDLTNVDGVKELMSTPNARRTPRKIAKTPKLQDYSMSGIEDLDGSIGMLKLTAKSPKPSVKKIKDFEQVLDAQDLRRTPKKVAKMPELQDYSVSSVEDVEVSGFFKQTPKTPKSLPLKVKRNEQVLVTPNARRTPGKVAKNSLSSIKTPKVNNSPHDVNKANGLKGILKKTPTTLQKKFANSFDAEEESVTAPEENPKFKDLPHNALEISEGFGELFKTPIKTPLINMHYDKEIISTTSASQTPKNIATIAIAQKSMSNLEDVEGISRLSKGSKTLSTKINALKHVVASPKVRQTPKNNNSGMKKGKRLTKTLEVNSSPHDMSNFDDLVGDEELFNTSPINVDNVMGITSTPEIRQTSTTPKTMSKVENLSKNALEDLEGVDRLFKTPKKSKINTEVVKEKAVDTKEAQQISKTPKRTPKSQTTPKDVMKVAATPEDQKIPRKRKRTPQVKILLTNTLEGVDGLDLLFQTPKTLLLNVDGVGEKMAISEQQLLKKVEDTPETRKNISDSSEYTEGIDTLFNTPLINVEDVEQVITTTEAKQTPKQDLDNVKGVKQRVTATKTQKEPENCLENLEGVGQLFRTPKVRKMSRDDSTNISLGNLFNASCDSASEAFDNLVNRKALRTYGSKSCSPTKVNLSPPKSCEVSPSVSLDVIKWVKNVTEVGDENESLETAEKTVDEPPEMLNMNEVRTKTAKPRKGRKLPAAGNKTKHEQSDTAIDTAETKSVGGSKSGLLTSRRNNGQFKSSAERNEVASEADVEMKTLQTVHGRKTRAAVGKSKATVLDADLKLASDTSVIRNEDNEGSETNKRLSKRRLRSRKDKEQVHLIEEVKIDKENQPIVKLRTRTGAALNKEKNRSNKRKSESNEANDTEDVTDNHRPNTRTRAGKRVVRGDESSHDESLVLLKKVTFKEEAQPIRKSKRTPRRPAKITEDFVSGEQQPKGSKGGAAVNIEGGGSESSMVSETEKMLKEEPQKDVKRKARPKRLVKEFTDLVEVSEEQPIVRNRKRKTTAEKIVEEAQDMLSKSVQISPGPVAKMTRRRAAAAKNTSYCDSDSHGPETKPQTRTKRVKAEVQPVRKSARTRK